MKTKLWQVSGERLEHLKKQPFLEHLKELRRRLITSFLAIVVTSVISFIFYDYIIALLSKPFEILETAIGEEVLFVNSILEGFLVKLKVAVMSGVVLSVPVHLFNAIKFVVPGLKKREKRVLAVALTCGFALIAFSLYYGYFEIIPISLAFLTNTGFIPADTGLLLSFGKNIFYILRFMIVTIVMFQLPIALEVLLVLKVLRRKTLFKASRFVVVGIFILSALLTPPDFITQLGLALPMIALYFLVILIAKIGKFGDD